MRFLKAVAALVISAPLGGCGTYIPTISEPWEKDDPGDRDHTALTSSGQLEFEIKKNIYCELRQAFIDLKDKKNKVSLQDGTILAETKWLPDEWGAQIALTMEVDDNGAVNPTFSYISRLNNMKNHFVGFGATLSSTATRLDKFNSYFNVGALRDSRAQHVFCEPGAIDPIAKGQPGRTVDPSHTSFLTGDLGIESWLTDALTVDMGIPSYGAPASASYKSTQVFVSSPDRSKKPPAGQTAAPNGTQPSSAGTGQAASGPGQDAVSIEIKFIVVTSGTVNPSWTLQRVTADTAMTPFLSAGRTRTHDLIITVGPPNAATDYANLSLQIGQAFNSASRTLLTTP